MLFKALCCAMTLFAGIGMIGVALRKRREERERR